MQSLFGRLTESRIETSTNRSPGYIFGVLVRTSDVVQKAIDHPWFLALNHMSPMQTDTSALERDAHKDGNSVVAPDHHRLESRKSWTYINPLIPSYSSAAGKTSTTPTSSDTNTTQYVHMVAHKREVPTGVVQFEQQNTRQVNTNTTMRPDEVSDTQPITPLAAPGSFQGTIPLPSDNQLKPFNPLGSGVSLQRTKYSFLKEGPDIFQSDINELGRSVRTRTTSVNSQGANAQTGTHLISSQEIISMATVGVFKF